MEPRCVYIPSLSTMVLFRFQRHLFYVYVCACLSTCMYTRCLQEPEEARIGTRSAGTGITDGFRASYGCWQLTLDPLWEPYVTLTAEQSPQYWVIMIYGPGEIHLWFWSSILRCIWSFIIENEGHERQLPPRWTSSDRSSESLQTLPHSYHIDTQSAMFCFLINNEKSWLIFISHNTL